MLQLPAEIIKKKRNKEKLTKEEISFFINGYTKGQIPDYQMSALLMAIYFCSLDKEETSFLTEAMLRSGQVVDLSSIPLAKVDKHSTGGVGDKTSLFLGPLVAAAGVAVPMISGRGLGHTGGTLDKLESIPGFNTQLSLSQFIENIRQHRICFIGQTPEICPADKKIYALRDVTATVESLGLICASIMSKKIAEGIDSLVLDVKFGSGAFMKTPAEAETLALRLMEIGKSFGKNVVALLTNMNQPLGRFAGNSLEVQEIVAILRNETHLSACGRDLTNETRELSLHLSAHMLQLGKAAATYEEAFALAEKTLKSGAAYDKFLELCRLHGGDLSRLPQPQHTYKISAAQSGILQSMNTEKIGVALLLLKAGRARAEDRIEPTAGIEFHFKVGDAVNAGDPLFTLYGADASLFPAAEKLLSTSFSISLQKMASEVLILKTLF